MLDAAANPAGGCANARPRRSRSRWWPRNGPRRFRRLPSGDYGFSDQLSSGPAPAHNMAVGVAAARVSRPRCWARRWSPMSRSPRKPTDGAGRSTGPSPQPNTEARRAADIVDATALPADRLQRPSRRRRAGTASIWQNRDTFADVVFPGIADDEHNHTPPTVGALLTADLRRRLCRCCAGRAPTGRHSPVQYVDYTLWQREILGDLDDSQPDRRAGLLGKCKAGGAGTAVVAQCSASTVADQRAAPGRWIGRCRCNKEKWIARHTTRISFLVVAAGYVLLSKLSGNSDVVVDFIAGRSDPVDNPGFCQHLVLRDLAGDPGKLLNQWCERGLAAYENQDVPEVLVDRSQTHSSLDPSPADEDGARTN